jgi:sugar diacid utilization regulator
VDLTWPLGSPGVSRAAEMRSIAENGHDPGDALGSVASLVRMAVSSDDPAPFLEVAATVVGRPLGLAGASGEPLGHAPDDDEGRRALAVARAAARHHLVAPPGWQIARLAHASTTLGFLAVGGCGEVGATSEAVADMLPALLSDQLQRMALVRAQRGAFERRLVTEPATSSDRVRREAADAGLTVSAAYWPAVLTWRHVTPPAAVVATVEREARSRKAGAAIVALDGRLVLLYPADEASPAQAADAWEWFRAVVDDARRLAPSARAQAIATHSAVELNRVSAEVAALVEDARFAPRADEARPVVSTRRFALDRLLSRSVGAVEARAYVDDCIGRLVTWDLGHRKNLLSVLEAALDFPRHDRAAESCYMHRNTFRRRLHQALRILGDDLDDPDVRLAVHVALKLRKVPLRPPAAAREPSTARRGAAPIGRRRVGSAPGARSRR